MEEAKNINITVSGWPGSGSTSLALILAVLLNRKYIYIGNLFRYLGSKFGYSNEGDSRPKFDVYIEDIIGKTIDRYIEYKLLNDSDFVIESDIAAFRIGRHPKVFSVFLITDFTERLKRVASDNRGNADLFLEKRDSTLQDSYKKLWNIDYFDVEFIRRRYSFVLDNSNMSLENEVALVLAELQQQPQFIQLSEEYWRNIMAQSQILVAKFWKQGKDSFKQVLKKKGLLIDAHEVLHDITKQFPEDVQQYPEKIRNIFLGIDHNK